MSLFLSPMSAFFALLLAPLIALYILKIKRRDETMPSTALWRKVVNDLEANTPFQKLRRNIILVMQVLFMLLATVALMHPVMSSTAREDRHWALVMDTSGSMMAVERDGKTRFELARGFASGIVMNAAEGDRFCVIDAGAPVKVVQAFSSDRSRILEVVSSLAPRPGAADLKEAFSMASALLEEAGTKTVCMITDGSDRGASEFPPSTAEVKYVAVGETSDNVAITGVSVSLAASREWLDKNEDNVLNGTVAEIPYEIFVQTRNFSTEQRRFFLSMTDPAKKAVMDSKEITIQAGDSGGHVFKGMYAPGRYEASIEIQDALPQDDRVGIDLSVPPFAKLLVVGEKDALFELLFSTIPDCIVRFSGTVQGVKVSDYDALVFLGPEKVFKDVDADCIYINPVDASSAGLTADYYSVTNIRDWDRDHPLLRFLDFSDVHVGKLRMIEPASEFKGLVFAENFAVIGVSEGERTRLLIPFDVYDSDWPLRSSFPMLFNNFLDVVKHKAAGRAVDPSGSAFSPEESDIAPKVRELKVGAKMLAGSPGQALNSNRDMWQLLVLLGLALVLAEWYVFHRRPLF